jgi:glycosyltransferase involved in cell wall biosynthesis
MLQTSANAEVLDHEHPIQPEQQLSIVVPVFNEAEVIDAFYERTKRVVDSLSFLTHEIIFVDDGSKDASYEKLVSLAALDPHVKVIKLSRNFGHQVAITAGTDSANGDAVVVIDGDLQDPPEVIRDFVEKWREGYEVIYGVRQLRQGETRLKLLTADVFYRTLKSLTKIDIPEAVGDFRLMSRRVVDELNGLRETDRYIRGLVSWIGFKQTGVYYLREKRYAGKTKFPYRKMLQFAWDGITSFSNVPLKFASWVGYLTSCLAFLYLLVVFVEKALGYTVEGWATIMVAMLLLGGVQLICLGILGEYIGRIFNESKQRPLYIIQERHGWQERAKANVSSLVTSGTVALSSGNRVALPSR